MHSLVKCNLINYLEIALTRCHFSLRSVLTMKQQYAYSCVHLLCGGCVADIVLLKLSMLVECFSVSTSGNVLYLGKNDNSLGL